MVSNEFLISIPFHDIPLFLGSPPPIYIWFYQGWQLVSHFNKYYTCFFTNLVVSKISFPYIFLYWIDPYSWTKKDDTHSGFMSCLMFIFWPTSSLSYTVRKCLTNVTNARIQLCSQSNFISTLLTHFQYFLTPVSPSFLATSMSTLLIAHLYLQARLIGLDARATFAGAVISTGPSNSYFPWLFPK